MTDTPTASVLAGRYRLVRRIASGGTASVHLAHDDLLDRPVAVKLLHPHLAEDQVFVDRFRREATAVAAVTHPHVVAIHDVARTGTWLVMELVDGHTLHDVLELRGRLSPPEVLSLLGPVAEGLGAAHDLGLVHRDVKPANVLVGRDGTVRIGDFGLARAAASSSQTFGAEAFAGSPHYLAPEVVRSEPVDARTDVYSLGIVLFELLTGRRPLDAETPLGVAMAHVEQRVPPPSTVVPGLPPSIDEVVRTATAADPEDRHADARAFARALTEAVPEGPAPVDLRAGPLDTVVMPRDMPATEVVARRHRPRPPRWLVAALVAVLVLAGGWFAWDQVLAPVVELPAVVGEDLATATATLEAAGVTVETAEPTTSLDVRAGAVVEVRPSTHARRGATVTLVPSAGPAQVEVPRLVGFGEGPAVEALEEAGLGVDLVRAFSDQVPAGEVLQTEPDAGVVVDEATTVQLVVSQGREPLEVPSLVGRSLQDAEAALADLGLQLGEVDRVDDEAVPVDHVVAQGEDPGTIRFRGDRVGVVVSDGPPPFALPDVRGQGESAATDSLRALGLEVEVVTVPTSSAGRVGQVDEQAPSAGQDVRAGEVVTLFVWEAEG